MNFEKRSFEKLGGYEKLCSALENNLSWILKSFENNDYLGSSKYRNVFGKWSEPYPETTGYLLITLLKARHFFSEKNLDSLITRQVEYFKSLQLKNGAFGISQDSKQAYVFDTSQIILGLIGVYNDDPKKDVLKLIEQAYHFLINTLNKDGNFEDYNFVENYNPSYYARIVWAMLDVEKLLALKHNPKTIKLFHNILSLQKENGTFKNCSFDGKETTYLHNIIYTYRGLWESCLILNDNVIQSKIEATIDNILSRTILKNKFINGEYNNEWKYKQKYTCAVGNAQLVCLLLRMFEKNENAKFLNATPELLYPLIKSQRISLFNKGGIPSSIPIWANYQRFKFTNWTQKFYADALLGVLGFINPNQ